jgi:hypothetical protein
MFVALVHHITSGCHTVIDSVPAPLLTCMHTRRVWAPRQPSSLRPGAHVGCGSCSRCVVYKQTLQT